MRDSRRVLRTVVVASLLGIVAFGCDSGGDSSTDVPSDVPDVPDGHEGTVEDGGEDGAPDDGAPGEVLDEATPEDAAGEDAPAEDVAPRDEGWAETDGGPMVDELGTNNQDIVGVTRVIFLGDSITATPYLTSPWSDRIRPDLRSLFVADTEFQNYAAWGARTEDVLSDQLPRIDTASTKRTLVMFTIGGNDALQVIGDDIDTSLAHMVTKLANLRAILDWLYDPAHFPGGVFVVYGNIYDPTDGEGDFTHCGVGASYADWPVVETLANTVNGWYLDEAMAHGADLLDMHGLFLGHGYNNTDTANPYYCRGCAPTCPCPRWFDLTCIHPSSDGHAALAAFFFGIVSR
jgi:lysophospholipase L1-like esterase